MKSLKFSILISSLFLLIATSAPLLSQNNSRLPGTNSVTTENMQWRFLGPSGMPNPVSSSNTYGVGQLNRLCFDAMYDGVENQTIYGCSFFGGLWRTEDDGENWSSVNTDFLPSTSVADVCINPFDRRQLFVCTGYGDGGIDDGWSPNWAQINPLPTTGIFRSNDYGATWQDISGNFLDFFPDGGMCRKMVINPLNPDQILVATTSGVIRTNNASAKVVRWENTFKNIDKELRDTRGIAYKPGNANVAYASGQDIFVSKDGGTSWHPLTGPETGIEIDNLPDSLVVRRINLAVSPAAPERLYVYILGHHEMKGKTILGAHIAIHESGKWEIIDTRFSTGLTYFAQHWIALAVSPVDGDAVFYGNSRLLGTEKIKNTPFGLRSPYCGNGFHADIHALAFQPNVDNPKLFCGNHGGVSVKTMPNAGQDGWEYKNEGLGVAILWSFDAAGFDENLFAVGTQDNGALIHMDTLGHQWHFIAGGDGFTTRIDDSSQSIYVSMHDRSLLKFNHHTLKMKHETAKLPFDSQVKKSNAITTKTFPLVNHPITGEPWFGFSEIYSKRIEDPTVMDHPDSIWVRQSDLFKTEIQAWRRQITDMAISTKNPNIIYLATGGQQNPPTEEWQLPSGLYKSSSGGLQGIDRSEAAFERLDYPGQYDNDDTLAIISGIAISKENPDELWITYLGVMPQYRIWHSKDGGINWENDDVDGIFADNPVNAIAISNGPSKRFWLGTDRGLYTKTIGTPWQPVPGFPHVRITEIKISEQFGRISVATFGRGLWEGLLPTE
ncbi:MAG TPA: hypothetical protein VFC92_07555 [Bacteroidales bacterium]|nr:hypothetical protein [Bacteroidales bacterium]